MNPGKIREEPIRTTKSSEKNTEDFDKHREDSQRGWFDLSEFDLESVSEYKWLVEDMSSKKVYYNDLLRRLGGSRGSTVKLLFDGSASPNPGLAGAGCCFFDESTGELLGYLSIPLGHKTSNEAEYTSLLYGVTVAHRAGIQHIKVFGDSELVVKQLSGEYKVKAVNLQTLNVMTMALVKEFESFQVSHIDRDQNQMADWHAKLAAQDNAKHGCSSCK